MLRGINIKNRDKLTRYLVRIYNFKKVSFANQEKVVTRLENIFLNKKCSKTISVTTGVLSFYLARHAPYIFSLSLGIFCIYHLQLESKFSFSDMVHNKSKTALHFLFNSTV